MSSQFDWQNLPFAYQKQTETYAVHLKTANGEMLNSMKVNS